MPRIRKKTSNRSKIHDRERLKKRVKDSKKKKAKLAKKNPQWVSKHKKDPGIPNDFPYKDQILAEVAEQRRAAEEEKERKKEEKRLAREAAKGIVRSTEEDEDDVSEAGEDDDEDEAPTKGMKDLNVGAEAIARLAAKSMSGQLKARPQPQLAEDLEDEEEEEPALVCADLPNLQAVLDASDVLLHVIDARDPLEYRSADLERVAREKGKEVVFVLNKIDLCPREAVSAWATHLRSIHPTFLFKSASAFLPPSLPPATTAPNPILPAPVPGKGKAKSPVGDALGAESLLAYLDSLAQEKEGEEPLTVGVVGVTNVGKSALINSLARRSALPIYSLSATSRGATTTELPQEVTLERDGKKPIRVVDTPGLSFEVDREAEGKEVARGRDILLRSRGRIDKLKDPAPPIAYLVTRANTEDLMLLYNLPAFAKNDATAFLSGVARSKQLIKKKGDLDLTGASRIVLRDWSIGRFARFTQPSKSVLAAQQQQEQEQKGEEAAPKKAEGKNTSDDVLAKLYAAADEAILPTLLPRKELRKAVGLVKLTAGAVDERKVNMEEEWAAEGESDEDEEDGEEFKGVMDVDEDDDDDEEEEEEDAEGEDDDEEEEEEEEEEEPVPVPTQKRKRGHAEPVPSKKVAFASAKGKKAVAGPKSKAEAPSSILKKRSTKSTAQDEDATPARPAKKLKQQKQPSSRPAKVANATASKKAAGAAANGDGSSEAYNFAQFF